MTIDRLNPIDPLQPKKSGHVEKTPKGISGDSVAVSSEAIEKAELFKGIEIAKAAPDVRAEKIAELKAKIDDPSYIDSRVLSETADRIIDQLFN